MGCASSHPLPEITYATVLPDTSNEEKGYGPIFRCPGYEKEFKFRPIPEIINIHDLFMKGMSRNPEGGYLGYRPIENGKAGEYTWITYNECNERMKAYARSLLKYELLSTTDGTQKRTDGTPMCTFGHYIKNCPAACISQHGIWKVNGTVVPLYDTLGPEAIAMIVQESELTSILCSPASCLMLLNCIKDEPRFGIIKNFIVDGEISEEMKTLAEKYSIRLFVFDQLVEEGRTLEELPSISAGKDDVAMICYTSGTTGVPKGAIITHGNMVGVTTAVIDYIDTIGGFDNTCSHLSYLPMAHVFEHFVQCGVTWYGARIGFYQGDTTKVVDDIKHLRPAIFASVPRLFNRITDSIFAKIRATGGIKEKLFNLAFKTKKENLFAEGRLDHPLWDKLVFKTVKETLGLENIRFMITGSAPIADDCLAALRCIFGCPVIQGLGLSETAGGICCSFMNDTATVGHCGGIICCAEARLVSVPEMGYRVTDTIHGEERDENGNIIVEGVPCQGRGEACFRGHNIIAGYYKRPEINKEAYDEEGWYHSGDIALFRPNGAIQIIDRKKDIFKLAQGEYISPDKITAVYQSCLLVGSLFVYGDSFQSYLVGIVVPDEVELRRELRNRGMEEADMEFAAMCKSNAVRAVVYECMVETANKSKLVGFEKIKNIYCDSEAWTVDNGMLTPTMKLKRDFSKNHYKQIIQQLYAEGMMKLETKKPEEVKPAEEVKPVEEVKPANIESAGNLCVCFKQKYFLFEKKLAIPPCFMGVFLAGAGFSSFGFSCTDGVVFISLSGISSSTQYSSKSILHSSYHPIHDNSPSNTSRTLVTNRFPGAGVLVGFCTLDFFAN